MFSSINFPAPPTMFEYRCKKMREKYEKAFLVDFGTNRMLTKEMWKRRYDLYDKDDPNDDNYSERSIYQFHYEFHPGMTRVPKRKICNLRWKFESRSVAWRTPGDTECENAVYEDLDYPQWDLETKYYDFEKWDTCSFMSKSDYDNIEKNKEMYLKIKDVQGDAKKWVEALMEANDHDFVVHSIEYRLGGNLDNKDLWLCYIDYLKISDTQKLLQTYSKFIRFFLEDVDMIDEYREAVQKYGPVLVPWKNTQDFETYDEHFFEKEKEHLSYERILPVESPPSLPRFNAENAITQCFPFSTKMINYILENASAEVLHKLYKTCKFFYQRFPKTLCYRVRVDNTEVPVTIMNLYLKVSNGWLANTPINNFFIANAFRHVSDGDTLSLSKFIPKIYQCSAKFIEIYNQQISFNELKVLIGHGNLLSLRLYSLVNDNGSCLILEDILQLTPYIKEIYFTNGVQCTADTAKKLYEMEFKNKIKCFCLFDLKNDLLDPHDFAKFVVKNCSPNAGIRVRFDFGGKEAFVKNFNEILSAALGNDFEKDDYRVLSPLLF